jgi:hypothetical protein
MKRVVCWLVASALLVWPAELPVTQVTLYKHGLGFFERSGTLNPGESARLDFTAPEMNDVLKSLTIEERGGGKITGLRYDSMDPLSHTLSEFPFQIGNAQPMSGMLDQLKGARLELKFGNDTVTGLVVNGRLIAGSDKQPEREQLTLMLDSGELRNVDLSAASGIRFNDAKLQQQFREYLAAVSAARSKEKRSVYIDSTDNKTRQVSASYMVPAPVWKSSYRLIFGASGQPVLEGWAIVDNTTSEDWTKVTLSLVSGRPISFVSQLYAPKYVTRPEAELADDSAARPVVHAPAFENLSVNGSPGGSGGGRGGGGMGAGTGAGIGGGRFQTLAGLAEPMAPQQSKKEPAPSTIVADASAGELGELFEYRIAQPVTIRKNESALLPFLQQAIAARKLLIYSDHRSTHPTNAAELTNNTGKTLDGGPITIYDAGAYGGEALVETVKAGDKRLISYAVDLGTRITEVFGSKAAVIRELHASRGILTTKVAAEETRTYTIRNVDQKSKTLILEHPLRQGYTLLNQKAAEKTPDAYRFEIPLAAGGSEEYAVSEERIYDQSYNITDMTPDRIGVYLQNRELSAAGRQQLQHISDQKSQLAETQNAIGDATSQVHDLTSDEDRIRQNIQSLNAVSGQQQQVQSYARQLDTHEQQLATLRDQLAELQKKRSGQQTNLNQLIEALAF